MMVYNYFKPAQGSAKLVVMPYYTSIFIKEDQTFYGMVISFMLIFMII